MSISLIIEKINSELPQSTQLVAVSKTYAEAYLQQAYDCGQRIFGESKVQEMCRKHDNLPCDIVWHMIGHLQSNKVKYIAPFVSMIHSVDSLRLLQEIDKQALKNNRVIDVLLEVFVAQEQTKHGLTPEEIRDLVAMPELKQLTNVRLRGLMTIGTFTDDLTLTKSEFMCVKDLFDELKGSGFDAFDTLSMGMSGDYMLACECGSTLVRVGSMIFGHRDYSK